MRLILRALPFGGLIAALVGGGVSAFASNNATWNTSFSVATATSLVNNTADANFGPVIPGTQSGWVNDSLTITTNDPAGVQLTAATVASVIESGGASPQANRTVPGSSIKMGPNATTVGTGGVSGTQVSAFPLSVAAQNMFATVPTNTGTLTEVAAVAILAPAATLPNS